MRCLCDICSCWRTVPRWWTRLLCSPATCWTSVARQHLESKANSMNHCASLDARICSPACWLSSAQLHPKRNNEGPKDRASLDGIIRSPAYFSPTSSREKKGQHKISTRTAGWKSSSPRHAGAVHPNTKLERTDTYSHLSSAVCKRVVSQHDDAMQACAIQERDKQESPELCFSQACGFSTR